MQSQFRHFCGSVVGVFAVIAATTVGAVESVILDTDFSSPSGLIDLSRLTAWGLDEAPGRSAFAVTNDGGTNALTMAPEVAPTFPINANVTKGSNLVTGVGFDPRWYGLNFKVTAYSTTYTIVSATETSLILNANYGGNTTVSAPATVYANFAGYPGPRDLHGFSCLDYRFATPIDHRRERLVVEVEARWNVLNKGEQSRVILTLCDTYPVDDPTVESAQKFTNNPFGTPGLHLRMRPDNTTTQLFLLEYGGGNGGEFELDLKYGVGPKWFPGFISNTDGTGNGSPGQGYEFPNGSWKNVGQYGATTYRTFRWEIEPHVQRLVVDGVVCGEMSLPERLPTAPQWRHYENFPALRLYVRGESPTWIRRMRITRGTASNSAPVAVDDVAIVEAGETATIAVLANDWDVNHDTLTVTVTTPPTGGIADVDGLGRIVYHPSTGFTGLDRLVYRIDDGNGGTTQGVVRIRVKAPVAIPLVGQVFDHLGRPVAGASVVSECGSSTTDGEGRFLLPGFAPGQSVTISAAGWGTTSTVVEALLERRFVLRPTGAAVPAIVTTVVRSETRAVKVPQTWKSSDGMNWLGSNLSAEYRKWLTTRVEERTYTVVELDNGLMRVVVSPDLGMRVLRASDRAGGDERQIFAVLDNPIAGTGNVAWEDAGGVEPSFPYHEAGTGMNLDPAGWYVDHHPDGSVDLVMHLRHDHHQDIKDLGFLGKWGDRTLTGVVTLRPGESRFTVRYVVDNPNPTRRNDRIWSDALFARSPGMEVIFPFAYAVDHGAANLFPVTFPIRDDDGRVSKFGLAPKFSFGGAYYATADANHLRIADPVKFPGAKLYFDKNQPNFFELWSSSNPLFETPMGFVGPWQPLTLETTYLMARGIGKVTWADDRVQIGVEGTNFALTTSVPGWVTVRKRGTATVLADHAGGPGIVLSGIFENGLDVAIDGVAVASVAFPLDLAGTTDYGSVHTNLRIQANLSSGTSGVGSGNLDARWGDHYEMETIQAKPWSLSQLAALRVFRAADLTNPVLAGLHSTDDPQILTSIATAAWRGGNFAKARDILTLIPGASRPGRADFLEALMRWEEGVPITGIVFTVTMPSEAGYFRSLQCVSTGDITGAISELDAVVLEMPDAVRPRLMRACLARRLDDALHCWRLVPGSPEVAAVLADLGDTNGLPRVSSLMVPPLAGSRLRDFLSGVTAGAWTPERRYEYNGVSALPTFPGAMRFPVWTQTVLPEISVIQPVDGVSISSPTDLVVAVSHPLMLKEVIFLTNGNQIARDCFAPYRHAWQPDPGTPLGLHTVSTIAVDILGNRRMSAPVRITIVNRPPKGNNDAATCRANTPLEVDVLANDTDADGDVLTVIGVSGALHGTANIVGNRVNYIPDPDWTGVENITCTISDTHGYTASSTLTITVVMAPMIVSVAPTSGVVGVVYTYVVAVTGAPAPSIVVAGLPSWLSVSTNVISGTPTNAGVFGLIVVTASNGVSPNAMQGFSITVPADSNLDGLPDEWQVLFFSSVGSPSAGPDADPDGDGMNNLQECLAGTDPTNPVSLLAIAESGPSEGLFVLRWQSAAGRLYSIQLSSNLIAGFCATLATDIPATPPVNAYTDTVHRSGALFYRVLLDQ